MMQLQLKESCDNNKEIGRLRKALETDGPTYIKSKGDCPFGYKSIIELRRRARMLARGSLFPEKQELQGRLERKTVQ